MDKFVPRENYEEKPLELVESEKLIGQNEAIFTPLGHSSTRLNLRKSPSILSRGRPFWARWVGLHSFSVRTDTVVVRFGSGESRHFSC